jgi:ketosteroid isomerase-like protein
VSVAPAGEPAANANPTDIAIDHASNVPNRLLDSFMPGAKFRTGSVQSGVEMEQPLGYLWEMRDGKATRLHFYRSHAEALKAVGLLE